MRRTAGVLAAAALAVAADAVAQDGVASDRAALEALYHATDGDGWADNTNWLSDAPLGDWFGVEAGEAGRVTGLRLGGWVDTAGEFVGNGLTGSLPAALGRLSRLRSLEIGGNRGLSGPIPVELGDLTNLESLILWANRLTGPVPSDLGHLVNLKGLLLGVNLLSGRVPPELGNLTELTALDFRDTMLSGPLPESLTSLSALDWLSLGGSGLCVPDTPAARAWVAAISEFEGAVCAGRASFLRVVTQPGLGVLAAVLAVADLDGDGRDDILAGGLDFIDHRPEDRFTKATLRVFVGEGDGSFRHAPELVEGAIDARAPIVVAADLNGDRRPDLAVFDGGAYVNSLGYGNPPQLFLSGRDGRLRPSDVLADAVRREHEMRPEPFYSGPADLHVKTATAGDIDADGDVDLWVDSIGGANVSSHFMVNNGDGTFTVDEARAPPARREPGWATRAPPHRSAPPTATP